MGVGNEPTAANRLVAATARVDCLRAFRNIVKVLTWMSPEMGESQLQKSFAIDRGEIMTEEMQVCSCSTRFFAGRSEEELGKEREVESSWPI